MICFKFLWYVSFVQISDQLRFHYFGRIMPPQLLYERLIKLISHQLCRFLLTYYEHAFTFFVIWVSGKVWNGMYVEIILERWTSIQGRCHPRARGEMKWLLKHCIAPVERMKCRPMDGDKVLASNAFDPWNGQWIQYSVPKQTTHWLHPCQCIPGLPPLWNIRNCGGNPQKRQQSHHQHFESSLVS